jgi:hypothetical protein
MVYVAPAFWLEGLGLLGLAAFRRGLPLRVGTRRPWFAATLFAVVLLGYPLLAPVAGRPWSSAALLGIMPDPTVVGTLAVLGVAVGRERWWLLPIPLLWCLLTGITLWGLGRWDWFVAPTGALLACLLPLASRHAATSVSP